MASRADIIAALRKADAAGDTAAARRFAAMLNGQGGSEKPQAAAPAKPDAYNGLMTGLHSFEDTATFGLGDRAAAALATGGQALGHALGADDAGITAAPVGYDANLAAIRGQGEAGAEAHPVEAIAGDVGGLFAGGGALGAGLKGAKALPVVGKIAQGADALLAARAGQPVANVARAALSSGAVGALDSAGHGGNIDQNLAAAGISAIAGPILGKLGGAVARRLTPVADRALRLLSDKIGETPAVLQRAFDGFRRATGRVPTMAELIGMKSRGELATVAGENPTIGVALNNTANAVDQARPGALGSKITAEAGGPMQDINSLVTAQGSRMDAAMKPIRNAQVPLDHATEDLLSDPRVREATDADPELRSRLAKTLQDIRDNGSGTMSIDDLDSLRQSIRSRQAVYANVNNTSHNSVVARQFGRIADEVTALTRPHVPEYGAALDQFGTDQGYIDAFRHGMGGKSIGEAEDPSLIRTLGTAEGQQGHASGVMSRLANRAGDSEAGANATALDLTQPGTIRAVAEAVGPHRASRLAEAAAYERRSKDALSAVTPSSITPQAGLDATGAAHAVGAAASHSPTGAIYHVIRSVFGSKLRMSQEVQTKVAQYLTDPTMTAQGIALLKRAGAQTADILRLQTAIAAATGAKVGDAISGGQ